MIAIQPPSQSAVASIFDKVYPAAVAATEVGMNRAVITLLQYIKTQKLSGQVLNRRSGTLSRSVSGRVDVVGDTVEGMFGTNLSYGVMWELGFQGAVEVREHMRKSKAKTAMVRAHTRNVNIKPRSYIRSAVEDKKAEVVEFLRAGIEEGLRAS